MRSYFKIDDGKDRHYGLDLIRVLAIVSVILYHYPRNAENLILRALSHYGNLGVDIFFVLSGFLIGGQVFSRLANDKNFNISDFFSRRFYRTLPLYFFVLLIHIFLNGADKYDWRFLFFLQNIGGLYYFTHSWSLCVEEHFYLLFPLVIYLLQKFKKLDSYLLLIGVLIIGTILLRYLIWSEYRPDLIYNTNYSKGFDVYFKYIFFPTYNRLDGIAIGTAIAYIRFFRPLLWGKMNKKSNFFLVFSIILFVLVSLFSWKRVYFFASTYSFSGYALSFGALLISVFSERSLLSKIRIPYITQFSILSYSLYLSHGFAISILLKAVNQTTLAGSLWPVWVLIFPLSFAIAYLFYIFVEKPFLKIRDRNKQ